MLADIKNLIKSIPPSYIKRIEIIRNPGASVSGSYKGAILNIVLTFPWEGFVGIVDAKADLRPDIFTPGGSVSLYYSKDKWSIGYSGGFRTNGDDDKNENFYEYKKDYPDGIKSYINDSYYRRWTNAISNYFTVNYDFTARSMLGLGVSLGWVETRQKNITTTTYTPITGEDYQIRSAVRDTIPFGSPSVGANLYYVLQTDDNGSNLDVVLGYYLNQSRTHTGMFYPDSTRFRNQSNYGVGWGGEVRYQHRFSRNIRLNTGVGFNTSNKDDALDFYEHSNRFIYKENLLHAFGELSFPWYRTSFVVGMRIESEFNTGDLPTTGESFKQNSTAVLADISFDWQMPWHDQSLSISLSEDINRPWLSWLNPFRIWTTGNAYAEGNPYLKNYYDLMGTINYVSVKNLTFTAEFYKSFGSHHSVTMPDPVQEEVMATKRVDGPGRYSLSAGVYYSKDLLSFWSIGTSLFYSFNHSKFVYEDIKFKCIFSRVGFSVKSIFNFSRKYGIFGTVYYDLGSPCKNYNDTRGAWDNQLIIDVRKDWKNCSLSLAVFGLIPLRYNDYNFDSDIYIAKYNKTNYGPGFLLNFRYVFGNKETRGTRLRNANAGRRLNQGSN